MPIVHFAYLVSRDTLESLDASPEAWARELSAYATTDAISKLPENPIVIVGGHRVRLWRDLEDLLAPRPVLVRNLGDAIVEDITYNYSRLVGFYQPDTVVLLPGNSEFHVRDAKSPESVVKAIAALVELDRNYGITRRFYIFTPLKTPRYPRDDATIEQTTRLLKAWARTDKRVVILDANTLLARADGSAKPDFYRADGVNLNEHGYLRLSILLQDQVEADTQ
ncbi:MAG: hypothetical protein V7700_10970 [Halioglobus sp.]